MAPLSRHSSPKRSRNGLNGPSNPPQTKSKSRPNTRHYRATHRTTSRAQRAARRRRRQRQLAIANNTQQKEEPTYEEEPHVHAPPWGAVLLYVVVFLGSVGALLVLTFRLPRDFNARFPHNLDDVRDLSHELSRYNTAHGFDVFVLFSCAYIWKQTFSIPGSAVLNLLAGSLFGAYWGFVLVCLLSATGASCCFLLSRHFGKQVCMWLFGDKIDSFRRRVESSENIFWMLLSMRIFPFTPNFILNSALPLVGVRLDHFFASVFFGLMPYCFVTVKAGLILDDLTNVSDAMSPMTVMKLAAVALTLLASMLLKSRMKKGQEMTFNDDPKS